MAGQARPKDDEWTTVPRGKRRAPTAAPRQPGTDRSLTLEKLLSDYEHRKRTWKASTCRRQVRQILDRKQPDGGWQGRHAVCLASGSFCRDNWECQKRSMMQFVAFMDVVEYLQASSDEKIEVVAQELVYAPLDIEFLSHLGVTAYSSLDDDRPGQGSASLKNHLGPKTFIFEPFIDKVLSAVKDMLTSSPMLLIGTSSPLLGANRITAEDLEQMRVLYKQFDVDYSSYYFPKFEEDPNVFEGLKISWKEPKDEDDND